MPNPLFNQHEMQIWDQIYEKGLISHFEMHVLQNMYFHNCRHEAWAVSRGGATVGVKIKFTFRNRRTIVQRSFYGAKTVQKTVLNYYYVSVYRIVFTVRKRDKTFNAYSGCSLCPTLFYLGYVLDPGSLSLVVFVRRLQLLQNRRYSGNAIDRCQNPAHQGESCWNLHILRKVWLICLIGRH